MNRFWYWLGPALGALIAAFSIYTLVALFQEEMLEIPSIQFGITGIFIFPGLLISLAVNQLILRRRRPRVVTTVERVLLGILVGLVVVIVATSFEVDSLTVGLIAWPILIFLAIAITIVILVTNAKFAAPVQDAPVEAAYGTPVPTDDAAEAAAAKELDDLFGTDKN